tara:strand:+ start:120 stop:512 length:393 start_codon:yes stop_codon:yes gene_type:complete
MSTEPLEYIAQRDYLTYLSEKLNDRRDFIWKLETDQPHNISLHCESLEHALDTVSARKAPMPKEYFDVFPTWETLYFPKCDPVVAADVQGLYKQGNSIEYLMWTYDLTLEAVIEHLYPGMTDLPDNIDIF